MPKNEVWPMFKDKFCTYNVIFFLILDDYMGQDKVYQSYINTESLYNIPGVLSKYVMYEGCSICDVYYTTALYHFARFRE